MILHGLIVACVHLSLLPTPAPADPARFWFSLSDTHPYKHCEYGDLGTAPGVPQLTLAPGAPADIFLWARAQSKPMGVADPFNLQNISLNFVLDPQQPPAVLATSVHIENPRNVASNQQRFGRVGDSDTPITFNNGVQIVSYPVVSPLEIHRFAAFTFSAPGDDIGIEQSCDPMNLDPGCNDDDGNASWMLARLRVQANNLGAGTFTTGARLQVGSMGITHGGENDPANPLTMVQFGADSATYIPATQRNISNLPGDTDDITFRVSTQRPGDASGDGDVNTVDIDPFSMALTNPTGYMAMYPQVDFLVANDLNCDGLVNTLDIDPFVKILTGGGAAHAPEPSTVGIAVLLICGLAASLRRPRRGIILMLPLLLLTSVGGNREANAAQLNAFWQGGAGLWTEAPLWSTDDFPDNGVDTYAVTIATGPSTVLLNTPVTVDNVIVATANAGLGISGTLNVVDFFDIISGGVSLNGGTIAGGMLQNVGGSLVYNNGILSGTTLVGDLDLTSGSNSVTFTNGATFLGNALLGGVESRLTYDGNFVVDGPLFTLNGTVSELTVTAGSQLTLGPTTQVDLSGPQATISGAGIHTVTNQGIINASGGGALGITLSTFVNEGVVDVASGQLTVAASTNLTNTGVLKARSGATLDINSSLTHTGAGELTGAGTVEVATFTNDAAVRPGDSPGLPGVLTIDGGYTQTANGVLEIEANGAGIGMHDQLAPTVATLAGRLDLALNYEPAVGGQPIKIIDATGVHERFDEYHVTGLPDEVAQAIVYGETDVEVHFVARTTSTLNTLGGVPGEWMVADTWVNDMIPDSTSRVELINGESQPAEVLVGPPSSGDPINAAHSVELDGGVHGVALSISGATLSVSTRTTIGDNATVNLSTGARLNTETVIVESGGRLEGAGAVRGDAEVGLLSGGPATFDPVGNVTIDGDYTQGADGVFAFEIAGPPLDPGNDLVMVDGDVTLSGVLEVDLSNFTLEDFTAGDRFTIVAASGEIAGDFSEINIVGTTGFHIRTEEVGVGDLLTRAAMVVKWGDINNSGKVDIHDADAFAAVLIDNQIFSYVSPEVFATSGQLLTEFDFTALMGGPADGVDFADIPGFAAAMSASCGISMPEAYAYIDAAIAEALRRNSVPEPGSTVLAASLALVTLRPRGLV